jgi:hypothetical protein
MRSFLALLVSLFILLTGTPALAQDGPWRVSEANGSVTVSSGGSTRAARVGATLEAGDAIRTGARSSAILVRGREFVTVRQNSSIKIAEPRRSRSVTQIIQDYGSALFNIGRQPDPHFGVETPYLAAVVKGTVFTITVSEEGATLQVTEGAVETSTLDGGASELILPGVVAMISADDSLRLVVEGDTRQVIDSPARPASAPSAAAPAAGSSVQSTPAGSSSTGSQATNARSPASNAQAGRYRPVQRISAAIYSEPADLGDISGGLVSGSADLPASVIIADTAVREPEIVAAVATRVSDLRNSGDALVCAGGSCAGFNIGGSANAGGSANGNSGGNGNGIAGGNGNGDSGGDGSSNAGGNGSSGNNGNSGDNDDSGDNGNSGDNGDSGDDGDDGKSGGNGNGNGNAGDDGNSGDNGNSGNDGNSGDNGDPDDDGRDNGADNGNDNDNDNGNDRDNGNGNDNGNDNGNGIGGGNRRGPSA